MPEPPVTITSLRNPRIVALRKLDQRKHRERQGRFAVEGLQLLHMALDAGLCPLELFYCEALFTGDQAPALLARTLALGGEAVPVSSDVMHRLSERTDPQGLVATFALLQRPPETLTLSPDALLVVVDRLNDAGNLGTLIRTADAVGAAAVALVTPCVDAFDPRTVRATMGSVFHVPLFEVSELATFFAHVRSKGLRVVGADAHLGQPWDERPWPGGVALVLGNEAQGLSADLRVEIDAWASLPMVGQAESLNVAVAGGVLMYAWLRANWPR